MEEENTQCNRCRHFKRYYIRGIRHYLTAEAGYCNKNKCGVTPQNTCDKFSLQYDCRKPSAGLLDKINSLFGQIAELSKLIEEEIEDSKEN